MNCVFIIIIILFAINLRTNKEKDNCLSLDWFNAQRAFFAMMVVFHHMVKYTSISNFPLTIYENLGYLSVSVFFLISGYGLTLKYENGRQNKYIARKIILLVLEYIFVFGLYAIWNILLDGYFDIQQLKSDFEQGILYVDNSWYILAIIIIYLAFDAFFWLKNNRYPDNKLIIWMSLFGLVYSILLIYLRWGTYWYVSYWAFVAGIVLRENKEKFIRVIREKQNVIMAVDIVIFAICFIGSLFRIPWSINFVLKVICSLSFSLLFVFLGMILRYESVPSIKLISKISLEIYLLHGLAFRILRNKLWFVNNEILFSICSIAICVCLAFLVNVATGYLFRKRMNQKT